MLITKEKSITKTKFNLIWTFPETGLHLVQRFSPDWVVENKMQKQNEPPEGQNYCSYVPV